MTTKVYRFGCARPSKAIRDQISEQLWLAYRYRLMLWHHSMASRALYRQRRRDHFPELERVEKELERQRELLGLLDSKTERAARQALKVEIQRLRARARELRAEAKSSESFSAIVDADKAREGELQRAIRGASSHLGLYTGTYLCVEDAWKRARSGKYDPARPYWDCTGILGIQLQNGRSVANVTSGRDPSIHIVPPDRKGKGRRSGSRTIVRYRIRSRNRLPVTVDLQTMVHRDLPADSKVTWAKLAVSRSGGRLIYSVQLTLESAANERTEFGGGYVAVCLHNDVVMYAGEGERERVFAFDARLDKADELQSIRDKQRNGAVGLIRAWCERQDDAPDWLLEEVEANCNRASCRRAVRLVWRFSALFPRPLNARDSKMFDRLIGTKDVVGFVYHENHLYQWQSDLRTNALRARKDAYLKWASDLRRKYRHVLLDSRRLDAPERKTESRNGAGLSELRQAIKNSFGPEYVHAVTGISCAEMFERLADESARAAE